MIFAFSIDQVEQRMHFVFSSFRTSGHAAHKPHRICRRVERFVVAHDCSGHKKYMAFLADQIKPYMDRDTDVVMADGACAGMLNILERLFPW